MAETTEQRTGDRIRRRAYLVALLCVSLLLLVLIIVGAASNLFERIMFATVIVYCLVLAVAIGTRRVSLGASEPLLLGPVVLVLFGYLVTWRLAPGSIEAASIDLVLTMLWLAVAFPLSFLAFGTRRGLLVCVGIYAAFLLLLLPPALTGQLAGGTGGPLALAIFHLAGLFAVSIALLWVLASRLEQLTAARATAERFAAEAGTDPLTGLANRRRLDDELDRQIALARRQERPLSAVLIDLDHFKQVNDTHGHETGDVVLREAADRLRRDIRSVDLLGRWGGEEFLLIAPDADHAAALGLAERCRERLRAEPIASVGTLTASFGVATLVPDDDHRALQRRADLALYTAKAEGRDRVVGIAGDLDPRVLDPRELPKDSESNGATG